MSVLALTPGQWTAVTWTAGDLAIQAAKGPLFIDTSGVLPIQQAQEGLALSAGQIVVVQESIAVSGTVNVAPASTSATYATINAV